MPTDDLSKRNAGQLRRNYFRNQLIAYNAAYANDVEYLYGNRAEDKYYELLSDGLLTLVGAEVTAINSRIDSEIVTLNNAIDAAELQARQQADAHGFRVKDQGALGNATDASPGTSDTAAFQATMNLAAGSFGQGGTMIIDALPNGTYYHLSDAVIIAHNVKIIGWGATVRKYSTSAEYSAFRTVSGTSQGYGSGGSDFVIEGLTFRGNFTTGHSCGVTLHHSRRPVFRFCKWIEAINNGHGIDNVGTDGLNVFGCTFQGFNPQTDREYVEAIQLDYSMNGAGGTDNVLSWDGLPTINATIEMNRFIPLTIGGTLYPAPNPTGCHSRVQQRWMENITFNNNYVEGCDSTQTVDAFALVARGWLHFFCSKGVKITNNYFKNSVNTVTGFGDTQKVIHFYSITTGTALADVAATNPTAVTLSPHMSAQDCIVSGNTFVGFSSDTNESLIEFRGTSTSNCKNIKIINNTFKDCYSTPGVSADKGSDCIYLQDCNGVELIGNNATDCRSLYYVFRSVNIRILGGKLTNLGQYPGRFSTCTDVIIRDVIVDGFGYGWWFYSGTTGIDIGGGIMKNARADGTNKFYFTFSGASEFSVHDMRLPFSTGWKALEAYTTSTKGRVKDVFATGFVNDAGFATINANSTVSLSVDY